MLPATPVPPHTPDRRTVQYDTSTLIEGGSMAQLVIEKRHQGKVHGLAWSPDGRLLASAASPLRSNTVHPVSFWDPETGKRVKTYAGLPADVENLWWSPDGTRIAGLAWNGVFQVWNWTTSEVLFERSFPRR